MATLHQTDFNQVQFEQYYKYTTTVDAKCLLAVKRSCKYPRLHRRLHLLTETPLDIDQVEGLLIVSTNKPVSSWLMGECSSPQYLLNQQ